MLHRLRFNQFLSHLHDTIYVPFSQCFNDSDLTNFYLISMIHTQRAFIPLIRIFKHKGTFSAELSLTFILSLNLLSSSKHTSAALKIL